MYTITRGNTLHSHKNGKTYLVENVVQQTEKWVKIEFAAVTENGLDITDAELQRSEFRTLTLADLSIG